MRKRSVLTARSFTIHNSFTHFASKYVIIYVEIFKKGVGFVDPLPRSWPEEGILSFDHIRFNIPVSPCYGVPHTMLC